MNRHRRRQLLGTEGILKLTSMAPTTPRLPHLPQKMTQALNDSPIIVPGGIRPASPSPRHRLR